MWNAPTEKQLEALPKLGDQEHTPLKDQIIKMHFFISGSDWYITEYGKEYREFFGYAILNGDIEMSEWGYISFDELLGIKVGYLEIDRDVYWKPKKAGEIKNIVIH